jgi:hypothetical protein
MTSGRKGRALTKARAFRGFLCVIVTREHTGEQKGITHLVTSSLLVALMDKLALAAAVSAVVAQAGELRVLSRRLFYPRRLLETAAKGSADGGLRTRSSSGLSRSGCKGEP